MKRNLLIMVLFLVFVSSAAAQDWFEGTFDDALADAKSEGKMVLVDFFSYG